ncbi:MAG TPA: hypothetical protein PKU94_07430 [Candidatus Hydrothermia bacterium]|nr:hypothetical protein [Candidatus Hydrothermae bacterium]MDD3649779.1 hypothetical protein [Candidatus Hydrothermia bacterium]MDD5573284.1 hypothetical protein [Candidatus Hydrothermia bacterium]HOK23690.1 hypothetical protein [Candidatus Hydrothermia bacterium]HOL24399.1 hypothetical protein [Candidatus Hydrothermia bacterium]
MVNMILATLLSWYSFFNITPFSSNATEELYYNGNPATVAEVEFLSAVSGAYWDRDSRLAEVNYFNKRFNVDFVFYNFGNFKYSGNFPVDDISITYSAFAYKFAVGYALALDKNLYFGIQPQYHRFEYYNQKADGFTFNTGLFHKLPPIHLHYGIFLRNFGLSSSEGYNFPGTLNLDIGYSPHSKVMLYYRYVRNVSDGALGIFGEGVNHEISARYDYRGMVKPSISLYMGDDLRVGTVSIKVNTSGRLFVLYDFTYRTNGFGPIHMITVGVE